MKTTANMISASKRRKINIIIAILALFVIIIVSGFFIIRSIQSGAVNSVAQNTTAADHSTESIPAEPTDDKEILAASAVQKDISGETDSINATTSATTDKNDISQETVSRANIQAATTESMSEPILTESQADIPTITDDDASSLTAAQGDLLNELMLALTNDEYEITAVLISSESYKSIVEQIAEKSEVIIEDENTSLIVYPSGDVYCGEFVDGVRSGTGIWFYGESYLEEYAYYKGQWFNDLPNGHGTDFYLTDIELRGEGYCQYSESTGIFKDGIYDGTFSVTMIDSVTTMDDDVKHHFTATYIDGVGKAMQGAVIEDDGRYNIAACDTCEDDYLICYGNQRYVFGFQPQ